MPSVTGFRPSVNGFHFINSWPQMPDFPADIWPFTYGAAAGVCGGMVFAVRDYFQAGLSIVPDRLNPLSDSQIFNFIASRLIDSISPTMWAQYWDWMGQSDEVCRKRTLLDQWPIVEKELNAGRLVCLGLIEAHSLWLGDVGLNHQVLAYGYDIVTTSAGWTGAAIKVYDPNSPDDDDAKLLVLWSNSPTPEPTDPGIETIPSDQFLRETIALSSDPLRIRGFLPSHIPQRFPRYRSVSHRTICLMRL